MIENPLRIQCPGSRIPKIFCYFSDVPELWLAEKLTHYQGRQLAIGSSTRTWYVLSPAAAYRVQMHNCLTIPHISDRMQLHAIIWVWSHQSRSHCLAWVGVGISPVTSTIPSSTPLSRIVTLMLDHFVLWHRVHLCPPKLCLLHTVGVWVRLAPQWPALPR